MERQVTFKSGNLTLAGKTGVHDSDLLIAAGCVDRIEVAYAFGHELRGLSPASRRMVESGRCQVTGEISNAGYQWRFLAAMMGVPFVVDGTFAMVALSVAFMALPYFVQL